MKNRLPFKISDYLPLLIAVIFILNVFLYAGVQLSGFFMIAIVLFSLKRWNFKRVALILSPIITYPLFLITLFYLGLLFDVPDEILFSLNFNAALYAVNYGLIFERLGEWQTPIKRKIAILSLSIVTGTTLFIAPIAIDCDVINRAEKGVSIEDIDYCKKYNLYRPYVTYKFTGINIEIIRFTTKGPAFTGIVVILALLLFEAKDYRKSKQA